MVELQSGGIPEVVRYVEWQLVAEPGSAGVSTAITPQRGYERRVLPGSRVHAAHSGLAIRLPWAALSARRPEPKDEIGVALTLHDVDGGCLEWFPDHQWGRVILVP
jgi:hypothetical protein